jgi:hypothetical protein
MGKNVGGGWIVNMTDRVVPARFKPFSRPFMGEIRVFNVREFSYNYFVTGEDE